MLKKLLFAAVAVFWAWIIITGISGLFEKNETIIVSENIEGKVVIDVFVRDECPHCKKEKEFLKELLDDRGDVVVNYRNIVYDRDQHEKWIKISEIHKMPKVTPITLVGNVVIQGFDTSETTGAKIITIIDQSKDREDIMTMDQYLESDGLGGRMEKVDNAVCDESGTSCVEDIPDLTFNIPLIGVINLAKYSLPTMSFVLGLIDGFNPCAMWVLITFLIILMKIGDKRKMLEIAGIFILAETIMYYLILTLWFSAWDFVKADNIVTPIVAIVAIGSGIFFLYEWKTSDGTCKVINPKQRVKFTDRIKKLASSKLTWLSFMGIIGLAFSVNVIEFACSIGIPQVFTKVLEMNLLSTITTHLYMLIYIIGYMIDDFIVFGIALYGMDRLHIATKYSKASNLIGGLLMITLGLILIFKRSWLVF